jgi:hypothetical protein
MTTQPLPSSPETSPNQTSTKPRRTSKPKTGRPTNRKKGGQYAWLKRLLAAGLTSEAAAWAKRHNLHTDGGAGVSSAPGRENLDKTTPAGQILQCDSVEPVGEVLIRGLPSDSHALIGASPSGEVEGKTQICQSGSISKADMQEVTIEDSVGLGGWAKECDGWVGVRSRNRDWVDVQIDGRWAKAWVRDVNVHYGTLERVRLKWVSEDGRDAEYEFVAAAKVMPVVVEEPEPVIEPIGGPEPVVVENVQPEIQQAGPDENPSATDVMERMRMQAFRDYMR